MFNFLFRQGLWCFFLLWAFPALGIISINSADVLSYTLVAVVANVTVYWTTLAAHMILAKVHDKEVFDDLEIIVDLPVLTLFSALSLVLDSILTSVELFSIWRTVVSGLFLALVTLAEPLDS